MDPCAVRIAVKRKELKLGPLVTPAMRPDPVAVGAHYIALGYLRCDGFGRHAAHLCHVERL